MGKLELQKNFDEKEKDLLRCFDCDVYLHPEESFICPRCRKGPLCKKHRAPGRKECASCMFEIRKKELKELAGQEKSIQHFQQFLQFIFIVFAVFFVALKFGLGQFVEILQEPMLARYLLYIGIISVAAYIIFTLILYNQRGKIADAELQLKELDSRR